MAQGSPTDLKHSIGHDVIVAEVDGDGAGAVHTLSAIEGWDSARCADGTITVNTLDGPAALGPVAVALGKKGLHIKSLTMRTPTLDDVFMAVTGSRIERKASIRDHGRGAGPWSREAGFVHNVGRLPVGLSVKYLGREPAAVVPAVFVPAFFYTVNLGALEKLAGTALDYKAFFLPMAIAFAVTGMSPGSCAGD